MVEFIKLAGDYLGLKTIPNFAKAHKMTYPGAAKQKVEILNVKFVIDND